MQEKARFTFPISNTSLLVTSEAFRPCLPAGIRAALPGNVDIIAQSASPPRGDSADLPVRILKLTAG